MPVRKINGLIALAALLVVFTVAAVAAETRLTVVTARPKITIGSLVMPAAVDTSIIWLGDSLARLDKADGTAFIYNQRDRVAYKLLTKFELYEETDFSKSTELPDSIPLQDALSAGLSTLGSDPGLQIAIEATADTSTTDGYFCRKYIVTEVKTALITARKTSEVWATTSIDVDFDLYRSILHISDLVDNGSLDLLPLYRQVEGVTVRRTGLIVPVVGPDSTEQPSMHIDGPDSSVLLKVEKLPAPAGLFEVPKSYEVAP